MYKHTIKVNKSMLDSSMITIPNDLALLVINDNNTTKTFNTIINFKNKDYEAIIIKATRNNKIYYRLEWKDISLTKELRKEYITSYVTLQCKNLNINNNDKLLETITLTPDNNKIKFKVLSKIPSQYEELFKKFVDNNVFYWLTNESNNSFILKSSDWISINELNKTPNHDYVVYYLIDTINKEIYIGSAKKLKERVHPNRNEINFNYFRYEIIKPEYYEYLKTIEYHSISNFARFLNNNANIKNINISEYKLVNKDCSGYYLK